jgi:hypothetical protein
LSPRSPDDLPVGVVLANAALFPKKESMRRKTALETALATTCLVGTLACSSGGGSHSGGGASLATTTAPGSTTPGSTTPGSTTNTAPPITQDWTGTWDVAGTDPVLGAYSGTVVVATSGTGYTAQRLVTYAKKLPDGRSLMAAWNATATAQQGGLQVSVALRRGHVMSRVGMLARGPADLLPLDLSAQLTAAAPVTFFQIGTQVSGTFSGTLPGPTETWTRSTTVAPLFPVKDETLVPTHPVPPAALKAASFAIYSRYYTLPAIIPYENRPEFQAAIHSNPVDHTARDFYQASGHTCVVILDEIVDGISIAEESIRADSFSQKLCEKEARFDSDIKTLHLATNGFLTAVVPGTTQRMTSGDGALHEGVWVASQAYRYMVTQDPEALANVQAGVAALCVLVDISPDKTTFARAIEDTAINAAGWTKGTGAYANLEWLPGGNNDMLHGIDYGFTAALLVLPASDPLRAQIGVQSRSLLTSCSLAQSGNHELFQSYACWNTTNDPAIQARYQNALTGTSNLVNRLWMSQGDGMVNLWGISDWSGHHLAQVDFCGLRILGGANPSADELSWRGTSATGLAAAFHNVGPCRECLLAVAAAAASVPLADGQAKDLLMEFPCPKPVGDDDIDMRVDGAFCMSPYPSVPWKNDWMTNPGRMQSIDGSPLFYKGPGDNYFNGNPFSFSDGVSAWRWPGQDYLHAYWLARLAGTIGPQD